MTSQNDLFAARQSQLAQLQQAALYGPSYGSLLGQAFPINPGFGIGVGAAPNRTLKSDFEEYMRECRREIDLG